MKDKRQGGMGQRLSGMASGCSKGETLFSVQTEACRAQKNSIISVATPPLI